MEDRSALFFFTPPANPSFAFHLLGPPVGKQRPIIAKGRAFTPNKTSITEQAIRDAWAKAGSVSFDDDPVGLIVVASFVRPKIHFGKNGLNKKGLENPIPKKHPDWDNIGKIVSDSLNSYAWRDDRQIALSIINKEWADVPSVYVYAWSLSHNCDIQVMWR